ncbi:unnamed protein product [Spirodela intermedia]|uniref:C2H2-type domain-containing protein n=1 Tax=Spirodela intermedia TaxID=51605 RepID=A0A7I8IWH5_SPIIN|nr:unnamed protein product [Spirodela intermedia]CAA6662121.1 unnamed protein product [Spirodela intermedia]
MKDKDGPTGLSEDLQRPEERNDANTQNLFAGGEGASRAAASAVAPVEARTDAIPCPYCGRTFRSRKAMFGHLRSHPKMKPCAPLFPGGPPKPAPAGDAAAANGSANGDTKGMETSVQDGVISVEEAANILLHFRSAIIDRLSTAAGGQCFVAARPYMRKRTKMQLIGQDKLNGGGVGGKGDSCHRDENPMKDAAANLLSFGSSFAASSIAAAGGNNLEAALPCGRKRMKKPQTGRPELNNGGGGKGNPCHQVGIGEIETKCCNGKRPEVGGSWRGGKDEERLDGRRMQTLERPNNAAVPTAAAARIPWNVQPAPRSRALDINLNRSPPPEHDSGDVPGTTHETPSLEWVSSSFA